MSHFRDLSSLVNLILAVKWLCQKLLFFCPCAFFSICCLFERSHFICTVSPMGTDYHLTVKVTKGSECPVGCNRKNTGFEVLHQPIPPRLGETKGR